MNSSENYFNLLLRINSEDLSMCNRYLKMCRLLEQLCFEFTVNERLQITDLSARINLLAATVKLKRNIIYDLQTFRLTSNNILNGRTDADESIFRRDWFTLAKAIEILFNTPIPHEISQNKNMGPDKNIYFNNLIKTKPLIRKLRVCYYKKDDDFLYVSPEDFVSKKLLKVRYNIKQTNDFFNNIIDNLWPLAQINLLEIEIENDGTLVPSFIVLEPDYLVDISSLAECFKDYGSSPVNYIYNRMNIVENNRPIILGNIVNLFLDEWIHKKDETNYDECMKKAFEKYGLHLTTCEGIHKREDAITFFNDCKMHFYHLRDTIKNVFPSPGYELNTNDAVLEPSYICEALGLQGRLDYMQRDMSSFIEMKSGKADEYSNPGHIEPRENNQTQMLLYLALLEFNMHIDHRNVHPYLLYTRYNLLYPSSSNWSQVKRAINVRNEIVAIEFHIQNKNSVDYTRSLFEKIEPKYLNKKHLTGKYWNNWLAPSIENFNKNLKCLSSIEQSYYYTLYNFITTEQYTAKSGDCDSESRRGICSLWRSTLAEKQDQGEILIDLTILENNANKESPTITFSIPNYENDFSSNFRNGDSILIYERNSNDENVTSRIIFKGAIEQINSNRIIISLRGLQRNMNVLPLASKYAIEHDAMDINFRQMYQSLTLFANANQSRRDTLLGISPPRFNNPIKLPFREDDFTSVVSQALASKDYYLLIGPPGTGKTSCALRKIVEGCLLNKQTQILLMAYTNRAVDEICKSLSRIDEQLDYIRIGHKYSCEKTFHKHLMNIVLKGCSNRKNIVERMQQCQIIIGTTSTIASNMEIFKLKKFDTAIIDEATQILEPHLLGLMCARCPNGENAIERFILIGDPKQLPAVVQQNKEHSLIKDPILTKAGFRDFRDSLFERLFRQLSISENNIACGMLYKQGRMHPTVAAFVNKYFYENKLQIVGRPHQLNSDPIYEPRISFIASAPNPCGTSYKCNAEEAFIAANLVKEIYNIAKDQFDPMRTVGIITPYRNQIALIKKQLQAIGIEDLTKIMVDTVERYQGSERDIIIYSFSVNTEMQLQYLPNELQEDGYVVDRKLNVALTRARKKIYIIGVPEILKKYPLYKELISSSTKI